MSNNLFCERLRALRKQAHLTQEAVSQKLQIHRSTYTKYECGVVAPDQQGLIRLAQLFGVTVDYLLGNDEGTNAALSGESHTTVTLSLEEQQLVQMFRQLTESEQRNLVERVQKTFRQKK